MKRLLLTFAAFVLSASTALAQANFGTGANPVPPTAGQNFSVCSALASQAVPVAITVTSSASTKLVSGTAGQQLHICSVKLLNTGGTAQFNYGTGTNCGTGTVHVTGALSATDGIAAYNSGVAVWVIPKGNDFCVAGGASAAGTGWLTYVQY